MRAVLLISIVSVFGCDTFRSIDSVPEPGTDASRDVGTPDIVDEADLDASRDMPADTGDIAPPPDMDVRDADRADASDMLDPSDVPDAGGPVTCPDTNPRAPEFTTAINHVVVDTTLDATDGVYEEVSIAASEQFAVAQFVTGHRVDRSSELATVLTGFPVDGTPDTISLSHAVASPFTDVAVARAPGVDRFGFLASAANPGCVTTGIQAVSGIVDVSSGIAQVDIATINDDCGNFVPRVALTGPDGTAPNSRLVRTAQVDGEVRAYPWDTTTVAGATMGNSLATHVSASTKDLVATPANGFDRWWLWRPGLAAPPLMLDLGGTGDLEVEHLHGDCYAATTPADQNAIIVPIDCESDCEAQSGMTLLVGERVNRTDVAPLPGGGFVVVSSVGEATQRLEARFFDDAFQIVPLDGELVVELVAPGPRIGDFSVATTRDAEDIFVGVVFTAIGPVDRRVGLSVLRIYLPDP